jgi:hypothetical protein
MGAAQTTATGLNRLAVLDADVDVDADAGMHDRRQRKGSPP